MGVSILRRSMLRLLEKRQNPITISDYRACVALTETQGFFMADQPLQVVFLDRDTISPQTSLRQLSFEHTLTVYGRTSRDQVAERIADADIVITNKVALRQEALEQAGRLKIVAVAAPGTDNLHPNGRESRREKWGQTQSAPGG